NTGSVVREPGSCQPELRFRLQTQGRAPDVGTKGLPVLPRVAEVCSVQPARAEGTPSRTPCGWPGCPEASMGVGPCEPPIEDSLPGRPYTAVRIAGSCARRSASSSRG